jgi:hypothetical protein
MKRLIGTLPEPPLSHLDVPENRPAIKQSELVSYANAQHTYRLARADFEGKRAGIVKKLLLYCSPEPGDMSVSLDKHGRLILVDSSSCGEPERTVD